MLSCAGCIGGKHLEHFNVFNSKVSQQHRYNTRNGYMPKVSRPRRYGTEIKHIKQLTIGLLPSELKRLIPKTIFNYKLKQFLLNHFELYLSLNDF